MPSDPTFETREALEAWARIEARMALAKDNPKAQLATVKVIRRVTLAHAHLLEDRNDD